MWSCYVVHTCIHDHKQTLQQHHFSSWPGTPLFHFWMAFFLSHENLSRQGHNFKKKHCFFVLWLCHVKYTESALSLSLHSTSSSLSARPHTHLITTPWHGHNFKKKHFLSQTCLPQNTSVSTPNSLCPCFKFLARFFAEAPPISQNKTVSKVNFSVIHLVRIVCELTLSIIQTHYTQMTSFCLHLQKSFSKNNAPCVLLLLMPMRPFLNGSCLVRSLFP